MGMRRRARELALQLLYQHEHTGADLDVMQTPAGRDLALKLYVAKKK